MGDDWAMNTILAVCGLLLAACFIGMGISADQAKEQADALRRQECKLWHERETGNRIYCGKACTRPEMERVYVCKNGPLVVTS